ncbi:MAG: lipid II flippase MurJ, partial [Patescibacteria group bacterium]
MSESTKNGSVVGAALVLGASSLASALVGLVRQRVFTTTFGAGDTFDAFVAAFRIPDLVFNLVVVGALSATFIPLFTDKLVQGKEGKKRAFDFALAVLNAVLLIVAACMAAYALLADRIVPLITPGFTGEKLELTILLSRIMAWQPILLSISFVFSGILNSFKKFVMYALAPILYNVGIIFGVLALVPMMGVTGLGWGVVL